MKRFLLLLVISIINSLWVMSQHAISGKVTDKNGDAIIGANAWIVGSYDGASTDANGYFKFMTTEGGQQQLSISSIGFELLTVNVDINGNVELDILVLKESINRLESVVISAGSFSTTEESRREVLKPLDIVTTAGASADVIGALNTLPGTSTVGEDGRLFVRGGAGNETATFIDGIRVMNPYNSSLPQTPGRSRFSPMMFKGTSFSTGGYSAEYGQALSSALILNTKDISISDRIDISLMTVGADIAGTKTWDNGSVSGKIQYTNLKPYFALVPQRIEMIRAPEAWDGNFAFRNKIGKEGMLKVYGNFNQSAMSGLIELQDDQFNPINYEIENNYYYINTSYKGILNSKWSLKTGVGLTHSNDDINAGNSNDLQKLDGLHTKISFGYDPNPAVSLNTGIELIHTSFSQNRENQGSLNQENYVISKYLFAGFSEMDLYTSNRFVTRLGGRIEFNQLINQFSFNPRISTGYKISDQSQVSLAYGKFNQEPELEYLKRKQHAKDETAEHFIVNYQFINNERTFRIEAYQKTYRNLISFQGVSENPISIQNNGNGYAKGIDIFWRDNKSIKNVDYWVSYSLLDTKRRYLNFPESSTPGFASKHNLSIVYKHFITDWKLQLGWSYSFASGRHYNDPNLEDFNSGITKVYHDLSANLSYLYRPNIIFHAFVTNITGRKNVFGYEFSSQPDGNGIYTSEAIRPMAPRFIFLGVFFTLSKTEGLNLLPNL